ncbi:MAG: tetratricopeptide repeat protein [Labilithrix sp.]|nr:tetratricopeptide repeat protein [Labilithrix sp.]
MRLWLVTVAATALFAFANLATAAPPAEAESDARRERALELSKRSKDAYREGRLSDAVTLLLEARELEREPVLVYNLARAYEGLGDADRALAAYEEYLREDPNARDRGAITQKIEVLRQQIADRRELEKQRNEALGRADREKTAPSWAPPGRPASAVPWVVAGAGVVVAAAGGVFGILALNRHQEAQDERSGMRAAEAQSSAETAASIANVCLLTGALVAVGGAAWGLVDLRSTRSSSTALRVAPGGVVLVAAF